MSGRAAGIEANDERRAKARRNAWLLGGIVVLFYGGIILWYVLRAQSGS